MGDDARMKYNNASVRDQVIASGGYQFLRIATVTVRNRMKSWAGKNHSTQCGCVGSNSNCFISRIWMGRHSSQIITCSRACENGQIRPENPRRVGAPHGEA